MNFQNYFKIYGINDNITFISDFKISEFLVEMKNNNFQF